MTAPIADPVWQATATQLTHAKICTTCHESWDNGLLACACVPSFQRFVSLAGELARQHRDRCGPGPGDPWDGDVWAGEAACLLAQIAGTT